MMFRIAKDLGYTVDELGETMLNKEFVEWCVYYERIEANRVTKQDMYLANLAYMQCGSAKAKPEDFLLKFESKKEKDNRLVKLSGKEMANIFKAVYCAKETEKK